MASTTSSGSAGPVPPVAWRVGRAERCPVGTCYLQGARLPCLPDCFHCRQAARVGCRCSRDTEVVPCPLCGHLPERIEDPGPLPRLNDSRGPACAFCHEPLADPTLKYCNNGTCYNGARREPRAGLEDGERVKGAPRSPRTYRVPMQRPGDGP